MSSNSLDAPRSAGDGRGFFLLLIGGSITTALALMGVWFAEQHGENIMGWYANYIIPAGALLVGLVASSGFGLSSWYTGTKITGARLLAVSALLVAGYFIAKFLEYRQLLPGGQLADGTHLGFWQYFDVTTRAFRWAAKYKSDSDGEPFGTLGYAMRALEIVGFAGGGLLAPLALRKKPYCDDCKRYMRTRTLGWIAAGRERRRVGKASRDEYLATNTDLAQEGLAQLEGIFAAARSGATETLQNKLAGTAALTRREASKFNTRLQICVDHCPGCASGNLRGMSHTGTGNQVRITKVDGMRLDPNTVAAIAGRSKLPEATIRPRGHG